MIYKPPPICPDDKTATLERIAQYKHYYKVKYDICRIIQPKTAVEIGVRAGYSSWVFLHACPDMYLTGIDANNGQHGGKGGEDGVFKRWAIDIMKDFNFTYIELNTQFVDALPVNGLDFIHIDGDHTASGVIHDFEISFKALNVGGYILIDDIDYIETVCNGVKYITDYFRTKIEFVKLPSLRGEMLIRKK